MAEKEEIERLMRSARVRTRVLEEAFKSEELDKIVSDAYSIMFMAAKATINHLGAETTNHRQVASIFRKELVGKRIINRKYADYLTKIRTYRDESLVENAEFDKEKYGPIVDACRDFVETLNKIMKDNPDPIIHYDLGDFA